MDRRPGRTPGLSKGLVTLLLFIFVLIPLSGQVPSEKEEEIQVFIYPDKHLRGKRITISYIIPREYRPGLSIPDMETPAGLDTIISPYIAAYNLETPEGIIPATHVKMIYRSLRRGIFTLKPFTIEGFDSEVKSPEIILPVLDSDEREYRFPLYISWAETLPEKIYVGQTVPLILLLENMETLSFPESVQFPTPRNSFLEKVSLITEIESSFIQETTVYRVPIETWMLTPSQSGTLSIPAASIKMGRVRRKTSSFSIDVIPLPEEVQDTGAVGDFSFASQISSVEAEESETIILDLILSGTGNFNYLKIPEPDFGDLVLIRRNEEQEIENTLQGYNGHLKISYLLQAENSGSYSIQIPSFRWVNPITGRIESVRRDSFSVRISEKSEIQPTQDSRNKQPLPLKAVQLHGIKLSFTNGYMYLFLLPGLLYLLLVLFFKKFGKKEVLFFTLASVLFTSSAPALFQKPYDGDVLGGIEFFNEKLYEDAIESFSEALNKAPDNPALLYNLGLVFEELNNPARAAYYYRKSLKIRPWLTSARKGISRVEKEYILEHQFPLPARINEELLFFFSLICVNGIFLGTAFYMRKRRVRDVILILSFSIIVIPLLGIQVYSRWERSRPYAVVGEVGGNFKKVPGEKASDWLMLTPGTTVLIQAHVDDYYQVKTGYNVKGWLIKDEIISLSEDTE